jgi:hypothetical protein
MLVVYLTAARVLFVIFNSHTREAKSKLPTPCCSFYQPMFEESLKTALREICDAVGSPELKDMDRGGSRRLRRAIINLNWQARERCLRPALVG